MSAEAEIRQFIDRILRLKEEQATLGGDIREVYAEAKGRGYDKTVLGNVVSHLRKVEKIGRDTLSEREAIFEMYLTAYETGGRAPASARTRENIEEFPVNAKLVATVANAVQTEPGRMALVTAVDILIEREEAEYIDPETGEIANSPETANEMDDDAIAAVKGQSRLANVADVETLSSSQTTPDPRTLSAADGQRSIPSSSPASAKSDGLPSIVGQDRESEMGNTGSKDEQAVTQFDPPAFLIKGQAAKTIRDYRPNCQKRDACGASGLKHCYSCARLTADESEVA
ncbi:uncharacterized protein (UPF0335 family) [Phyllobacterium sp. 1468]|uniref:DUF2312 domain-containing protein n=1 Tax=Phyllobacterium sp. 1468 TaxID=2817759 RepID=UPI002857166A|nr:DUF2312 domain-containing protein [Phyllobacterium sp. 1468]MDR6632375.1 uncharacterized protein (UPF0335 family) [Phyllobacterium sp. 1468]